MGRLRLELCASPAAVAAWAWRETGGAWWLDDASASPGWSYVAWSPSSMARGKDAAWRALEETAARPSRGGDGPPFQSGLVGWLGYDAGRRRPGVRTVRPHPRWPAARLARFAGVLAHHPARGWWWTGEGRPRLPRALPEPQVCQTGGRLEPEAGEGWHDDAVGEVLAAIARGEMYEANLTLRLRGTARDPFALYLAFREASASRRGAFIGEDGAALGCGSPERLLGARGSRAVSEPMKGTAAAGHGARLGRDPKERAELAIAVDLVRDDLHRVSRPGSVGVEGGGVEALPTLDQASAKVRCRLKGAKRPWHALRALLPSGSVTGAPRSTVMPLLDRLEPSPRGPYTGALGWFADGGDMEAALPIRTFLWHEEELEYGVGGGVTRRSEAPAEWGECQAKAAAIAGCLAGGVSW